MLTCPHLKTLSTITISKKLKSAEKPIKPYETSLRIEWEIGRINFFKIQYLSDRLSQLNPIE